MTKSEKKDLLTTYLSQEIITSKELTPSAKLLLAYICRWNCTDKAQENGYCFRTNSQLMKDLEIGSEHTIIDARNNLSLKGFINFKSGNRTDGATIYILLQKDGLLLQKTNTESAVKSAVIKQEKCSNNCSKKCSNNCSNNNESLLLIINDLQKRIELLENEIAVIKCSNNCSNKSELLQNEKCSTDIDIEKELVNSSNISNTSGTINAENKTINSTNKLIETRTYVKPCEEVDDIPFGVDETDACTSNGGNTANKTDIISIESNSENVEVPETQHSDSEENRNAVEISDAIRQKISRAINVLPTFTKKVRAFKENCTEERIKGNNVIKFFAKNRNAATASQAETLEQMIREFQKAVSDRDRLVGSDLAENERQKRGEIDCNKPSPKVDVTSAEYQLSIGNRVLWEKCDHEKGIAQLAHSKLDSKELDEAIKDYVWQRTAGYREGSGMIQVYEMQVKNKINEIKAHQRI